MSSSQSDSEQYFPKVRKIIRPIKSRSGDLHEWVFVSHFPSWIGFCSFLASRVASQSFNEVSEISLVRCPHSLDFLYANNSYVITVRAHFAWSILYISDRIYEHQASVSVYRSYAKCVLGTKTLTLPTQDNGWLSAPPTELCNYHDNHSQQRPDSAGYGKLRTRYLPVKAYTEHFCLLKELSQNSPLPTPLVLTPRPDPPTHR